MTNIKWIVNRLSKMPPAELFYRIQHQIKAKSDELFLNGRLLPNEKNFELSGLKIFSEYIERKLLSALHGSEKINPLLTQADQCLNNKISIFGTQYDFGQDIN
jgi:hypothetical protein